MGEVVIFKPFTEESEYVSVQNLISRIVGVAGDVIEIRSGDLYRNGQAITDEHYVKRSSDSLYSLRGFSPIKVPAGHVFAMGDNRDDSNDSRVWGPVPIENVSGQVLLIYWSWGGKADGRNKIRTSRIGDRVK